MQTEETQMQEAMKKAQEQAQSVETEETSAHEHEVAQDNAQTETETKEFDANALIEENEALKAKLADLEASSKSKIDSLVQLALTKKGKPYVRAGSGPNSFDCSGFTQFVYRQAGIVLPRNAREQILTGEEVPYDFARMRPGDLLFYGTPASPGRRMVVSHVAMYFGDRKIIHSSQLVRISSLTPDGEDFYDRQPLAVRRILGHVDDGSGIRSVAARPWFF